MTPQVLEVEEVAFSVMLLTGDKIRCKRIERDGRGGLWVRSTLDERISSAKIFKILRSVG